ncbi:aminotransferase class I/II-fold pyridoxal phosphate-dependent enzyme [Nocardia sp. NPDC127526]|uniref:aminotransferase class I/II-fold pyridoxal phosphate-dependent enzyme n=1 Tax=Nocardia sp. NPDC127526 TaxID=3345393 RepID=UPI003626B9DB
MKSNWQSSKIRAARSHQDLVWSSSVNDLNVVARDGKEIVLDDGRRMVEFVSCSYLGLETHEDLGVAAVNAIAQFGVQLSVARTRIKVDLFDQLEERLGAICAGAHAVVFNSVTAAHLAVFPLLGSGELPGFSLRRNGPVFVMDRTAHATIQINRGLLGQFGEVLRCDFNDKQALSELIRRCSGDNRTVITISDSVGSMGGVVDIAWLLAELEKVDGYAYVDDAHGTSVFGRFGSGYALRSLDHVFPERLILAGSTSKAFGATGGFAALPKRGTADFIKRHSVSYAFGGPPSLPGIAAAVASAALHLDGEVERRQRTLQDRIRLFDETAPGEIINRGTEMPIRGILIGDESSAVEKARALHSRGFATTTAMFPTVPLGEAMLRVALSSEHSPEQLRAFTAALAQVR